jgi:hypothetical protein
VNKEQTINISKNGGSMIPIREVKESQLAPNNPRLEDASFSPFKDDMGQSSYITNNYPSGVSVEDIQKVTKLLDLKKEMCILCKSKIRSLKVDENIMSNNLCKKDKFQNRKTIVEEVHAKLVEVE